MTKCEFVLLSARKEKLRDAFNERWIFLCDESQAFLDQNDAKFTSKELTESLRNHLRKRLGEKYGIPVAAKLKRLTDGLATVDQSEGKRPIVCLGPRCRAFALYYASGEKTVSDFAKSLVRHRAMRSLPSENTTLEQDIRSGISVQNDRAISPELCRAMYAAATPGPLQSLLQRWGMSAREFDRIPRTGRKALDDLIAQLQGEQGWQQPFPTDRTLFFEPGDDRHARLTELLDWATSTDDDQPIIMNVVDANQPKGLSAMGQALTQEFTARFEQQRDGAERRRPLYIPLQGDIRPEKPHFNRRPIGYSQLLAYLMAFYSEGLQAVGAQPPVTRDIAMMEYVTALRQHMVDRPQLLILDGVFQFRTASTDGRTPSVLERVIADQHVLRLLAQLMSPPPCTSNDPALMKLWKENRILVLSDFRIKEIGDTARYVPQSLIADTTLPEPQESAWINIVKSHGLRNPDCMSAELIDGLRDADFAVLDATFTLDGGKISSSLSRDLRATKKKSGEARTAALMKMLAAKLRDKRPFGFVMLYMIALSPDGVKRNTLFRLCWRMLESGSPHALVTRDRLAQWTEEPVDADDWDARFSQLWRYFNSVLEATMSDLRLILYEGFEDPLLSNPEKNAPNGPHPSEHYYEGWSEQMADALTEHADKGAISFTMPQFHRAARLAADTWMSQPEHGFVNRAFADEAFWQSGTIFRHEDMGQVVGIRPWRRFMSGIYFGLQSLPIALLDGENAITILEKDANSQPYVDLGTMATVGPNHPWKYWAWLANFCFRRVLEGGRLQRLSRLFGQEALRRDILESMIHPHHLWSETRQTREGGNLRASAEGLTSPMGIVVRGLYGAGKSHSGKSKTGSETVGSYTIKELIHSDLAMDDLASVKDTLDTARETAGSTRHLDDISQFELHMGLLRVNLKGLETLPDDLPKPGDLIRALRGKTGSEERSSQVVDAIREDVRTNVAILKGDTSQAQLTDLTAIAVEIFRPKEDPKRRPKANLLASQAVLLRRYGEYGFLRASVGQDAHGDFLVDLPLDATGIPDADTIEAQAHKIIFARDLPTDAPGHTLLCLVSLSCLRMAEALRLTVFDAAPLSPAYLADARVARNHVRALLHGHKMHRDLTGTDRPSPFLLAARQMVDTTTRHIYPYPPERAAQLIIEAGYLRIAMPESHAEEAHRYALAHLAKAEEIILEHGRDFRSRFPLHWERAMQLIALVQQEEDLNERATLLASARREIARLDQLPQGAGLVGTDPDDTTLYSLLHRRLTKLLAALNPDDENDVQTAQGASRH